MALQHWHIYVVRCSDGSLYTGVSEDVGHAVETLNDGEGNPYVRARLPVALAYSEEYMNRLDAEKRAEAVRRMSRQLKESLCGVPVAPVAAEWGFAS